MKTLTKEEQLRIISYAHIIYIILPKIQKEGNIDLNLYNNIVIKEGLGEVCNYSYEEQMRRALMQLESFFLRCLQN